MALINCPECNREISDKAQKCPNCGFPLKTEISDEPVVSPNNQNKVLCPSCQSNNTQTIKMMCLNGTTSGSTTGIGVSSDLDIGAGKLNSESKTALAEKFTPETSPENTACGCGCLSLIIGTVIIIAGFVSSDEGSGMLALIFGLPAVIISFIFFSKIGKDNPKQREWKAKVRLYNEGWICHKCGHTWLPSDAAIDSSDIDFNTQPKHDVDSKNSRFFSEETIKLTLRIITGLFVGICSGYVIVSALEVVFKFYGMLSNILIIAFVIASVSYSLNKKHFINMVDSLLVTNVVTFWLAICFFLLFNVKSMNNNLLLSNMSLISKISNNTMQVLMVGIPGYISLFILLVLMNKKQFSVSTDCKRQNHKIRNMFWFIVYAIFVLILISCKLFNHNDMLSLAKIKQQGWSHIGNSTYANFNSIKKTSTGNIILETADASEYDVINKLYEVNCKDKSFMVLYEVMWFENYVIEKMAISWWQPIPVGADQNIVKCLNEACLRTYFASTLKNNSKLQ